MKILVTGGAGYVGCALVPMLLSYGHHVRVVDVLRYGGHGLLTQCREDALEICRADVCDEAAIARALNGVNLVVHLAAVVGSPACSLEPGLAKSTNIEGTRLILALRRRDQGIILASTCSVYGRATQDYCNEATPVAPTTLYAETKAINEDMVMRAGNAILYRFPTAFGLSARMRLDLLPNNLTYRAVADGEISLFQASARRSFIHVTDMARALAFAVEAWSRLRDNIYNVGHESLNHTKGDLARKIQERTKCVVRENDVDIDPDQRDYFVSYDEIGRRGFRTTVSLDSGIDEMIRAAPILAAAPTVLYNAL